MIHVRNLTYSHPPGNITALQNIDLEIRPGERIAVIGPNGSGKSTLARCLNGLLRPESGEIEVDGLSVCSQENDFDIRQRVGMVFQNPDDQLVATSVEEELAFGLENIGTPTAEMRSRVDSTLAEFELDSFRNFPPHQLSGGEKQRVAVAAAMALRPRYLILDEPTSLLDPKGRREVDSILSSLHAEYEVATIHITQFPEEAARCERVVALDRGRLLFDEPPEQAFADHRRLTQIGLDVPFPSFVADRLRRFKNVDPGRHLTASSLASALTRLVPAPEPIPPKPRLPEQGRTKIRTENLVHTYDRGLPTARKGLDDVSVEIPERSIVALVGASGSGKTTFAQHLNALLKPERGRVLLDEQDIWGDSEKTALRRKVGLVFQFPELQLFEETVALDVAFGPKNLGLDTAMIEVQVTAALEAVGLSRDEFGDRSPFTLSGGEKRRVAIAGVLAMGPDVLVLDEPTAGLDAGSKRILSERLRSLNDAGTTILLISHDMSLVAELARYLVLLEKGRARWQGIVEDSFHDSILAADRLVEPPRAVHLLRQLAEFGWPVPPGIITEREVSDFVLAAFDETTDSDEKSES